MTAKIYRDRLINEVRAALVEFENIQEVEHPGLVGRFRELVCAKLLTPMLPSGYSMGSGKICDPDGRLSQETDVVIYNSSILPPIMYSQIDGIFPFHSAFYAIEVKSKVTSMEVRDSIAKARSLMALRDVPEHADETKEIRVSHPIFVLFGFSSDLEGTNKTELDRYLELDPRGMENPAVRVICVARKGYWYFGYSPSGWRFHTCSEDYDEVIDLVSGISNTLARAQLDARIGLLGHYTMIERDAKIVLANDNQINRRQS